MTKIACTNCGVRFLPRASQLQHSDYWCARCHYLAKLKSRQQSRLVELYDGVIEVQKIYIKDLERSIDALRADKMEKWKCSDCGKWFEPSGRNRKQGRRVCGPCQYRSAKKLKKMYAATRRELVNSGGAGEIKTCTQCGDAFAPTPSQLRHSNYVCKPCRNMARRKEKL